MKATTFTLLAIGFALMTLHCGGEMLTEASGQGGQNDASMGALIGKATLFPSSPVVRPGESSEKPAVGFTFEIKDEKGKKAGSVTTNDKGEYKINLAPGTYRVEMPSAVPGPGISKDLPATVVITKGKDTRLDIRIDSGIR